MLKNKSDQKNGQHGTGRQKFLGLSFDLKMLGDWRSFRTNMVDRGKGKKYMVPAIFSLKHILGLP